jgi:hypothetical protein
MSFSFLDPILKRERDGPLYTYGQGSGFDNCKLQGDGFGNGFLEFPAGSEESEIKVVETIGVGVYNLQGLSRLSIMR